MPPTRYSWETGTAYDFFLSLKVLFSPDRFNVRPAWAAGMRSRIPIDYHPILTLAFEGFHFFPIFEWLTELPDPTDALDVIEDLKGKSDEERLELLFFGHNTERPYRDLFIDIARKGNWSVDDLKECMRYFGNHVSGLRPTKSKAESILSLWADGAMFGTEIMRAFEIYYDAFFQEEEERIRPYHKRGIADAQSRANSMAFDDLFLKLSHGVALSNETSPDHVTFAPSFWITPLIYVDALQDNGLLYIYGVRPLGLSLVPGETVPDPLLNGLKALADPTRLRVLHALRSETLTPTQIANKLRLRPPTVLHHLDILRATGLVQLTVGSKERYYSLRESGVRDIGSLLEDFISQ